MAVLTTRKMILTILTILTTWGVSNCLLQKNAQTFVDRNGHVVTLHCVREKRPLSPLPRCGRAFQRHRKGCIKREQNEVNFDNAEREQARPVVKARLGSMHNVPMFEACRNWTP